MEPASLNLPSEDVIIPTRNHKTLRAWFIPAGATHTPAPGLVLVHGWSRNASQLLHLAPLLHAAGFAVLLFDARGHGSSAADGPITIRKFREDVSSAVDYLAERPEVDAARIGAIGHSIGASGSILAAAADKRIRALVSSSAFADPRPLTARVLESKHLPPFLFLALVQWFIERWLGAGMDEFAPVRQVAQIAVPLLLLHGAGDHFIPASDMDALRSHGRSNCTQTHLIPRRDHSSVLYHPTSAGRSLTSWWLP
jgi:dienelactone hydrolase